MKKYTILALALVYVTTIFASSNRESSFAKISGTHENLRFLTMLAKGTNQTDCVAITQDTLFSLQQTGAINNRTKSLVICESSIQGVNFVAAGSNQPTLQKVLCPDDHGNIRDLNCYYGNFAIQEMDFRQTR